MFFVNKQVTDVTNSPNLVTSQIFFLGMEEIKTVFEIIMILDSFKSDRSNI